MRIFIESLHLGLKQNAFFSFLPCAKMLNFVFAEISISAKYQCENDFAKMKIFLSTLFERICQLFQDTSYDVTTFQFAASHAVHSVKTPK
jgi:hypothetical protein